jgi:sugar diacid utilization regulator
MPRTEKLVPRDSWISQPAAVPAAAERMASTHALPMASTAALRSVAQRIAVREGELARTIVARVGTDIVNPGLVEGEPEFDEAVRFTRANIESLLSWVTRGEPISQALLQATRRMAQHLLSQGISLTALQHGGRVWGAIVWDAVLAATRVDNPAEREAALAIGSRIWRHVDVISMTAAHAYLDEVTDRGLMGSELLTTLLTGHGETEFADRLARSLHRQLGESYVVVLVRGEGVPIEDAPERPLAARVALDHIVEAARNYLRPSAGSLLAGIRLGDLVALYPVSGPTELRRVQRDCEALASALRIEVSVGMSGWHPGLAGIALGYAEAREAVEIAAGTGIRGRAIALEDVVVDLMVRSSPHAQRMLDSVLTPLLEYDRLHHAELIETLRAYLAADTNLTQTARRLSVHPNTAVYRLRRVHELTGRDPRAVDELLVLFLALKLAELKPAA